MYKDFESERVMRWQLTLEEFSPEIIYIKSSKNISVYACSRLDKIYNLNNNSDKVEPTLDSLNDLYFRLLPTMYRKENEIEYLLGNVIFSQLCLCAKCEFQLLAPM